MANLPVPTLASEISGNFFTAALARAGIYNAGTFLLNPPLFVGTQGTTQSVTSSSWTALTLDTEQVDSYGGHSTSSNTSRYIAQVAGVYAVCGVASWASSATGVRGTRLHVNGSVVQGSAQMTLPSGDSGSAIATPVRTVRLAAGDYVEVAGWQSSGGALATTVTTDVACALWVCWSGT
ncbi:hypothetical protein AB0N17_02895 [Streptomyces sp. NPDC051133]|uniref:hypothetical protein n=1 Tax=Streptomyces sp. NPDC051133 TaxID=3155521 RepID=UPI00341C9812